MNPNFKVILSMTQPELKATMRKYLSDVGYTTITNKDGFLFAKGNLPVLLLAHLDTVHKEVPQAICVDADKGVVMAPNGIGGDDRCGVYMISELVRELKCSVLLLEDEECGTIGAGKFCKYYPNIKKLPKFNYLIEMDRKGKNDCVFYSCDNTEFTEFIEGFGWKTEHGSCSDISKIAPHLKTAAVNLSSGYYNPHCSNEYIVLSEVQENIERIAKMIETKSKHFEYVEKKYTYTNSGTGWSGYSGYSGYYGRYSVYDDYYGVGTQNTTNYTLKPLEYDGKKYERQCTCGAFVTESSATIGWCWSCGKRILPISDTDKSLIKTKTCKSCGCSSIATNWVGGKCPFCDEGDRPKNEYCKYCGDLMDDEQELAQGYCFGCAEMVRVYGADYMDENVTPRCEICGEELIDYAEIENGMCAACFAEYIEEPPTQPTTQKATTNPTKKNKKSRKFRS